jgi:hypothetical protein
MSRPAVISVLARSLLAGEPEVDDLLARAARTLGHNWRWLRPLVVRYLDAFAGRTRPRHRDAVQFLLDDEGFRQAHARHRREIQIAEWLPAPSRMQPVPAAQSWNLPAIESAGDLAAWLSLEPVELEWLADPKGLCCKVGSASLQHYHYRILPKRSGGIRLTESPKPRLKEVQRRILSGVLDSIPSHPAVHGFVKHRSIATFAAPHAGKKVLLRLDLRNFFPAFPAARIHAFFRTLGYPETVAIGLAGLCSNSVPRSFWSFPPAGIEVAQWRDACTLYSRPHLPQGAPTSPALANLMAFRLDCRLSALARSAGALYTRYADDLAFSGDEAFHRVVGRFRSHAAAVVLEEGFAVNHHKTRIMRQSVRQHLAGIVVNQTPSLRRRDLDILEAILTNCVRLGPESQNRDFHPNFRAHLEGRIAFVQMIHPAKARRLRQLFDSIDWVRV